MRALYVFTGAMYAEEGCVVNMDGDTYFNDNAARFYGGKNGHGERKHRFVRRMSGTART